MISSFVNSIFLRFTSFALVIFSYALFAQNDGSPDAEFGYGTFNDKVYATKVLGDGKIIVAGNFTKFENTPVNRIARLNADGTLDETFDAGLGANARIDVLKIQFNGKIIVGGKFTSFNGIEHNRLVRLNSDGSVDNTFAIGTGFNNDVLAIAEYGGTIFVGGAFTSFNGATSNRIIGLNTDGSVYTSFNVGSGANATVRTIYPSGGLFVGGDFTYFNGVAHNRIVNVSNADGTFVSGFSSGTGFNNSVYVIEYVYGRYLVGGDFTSYNGLVCNRLAGLLTNGDRDLTFTGVSATGIVRSITALPGSFMYVSGDFVAFNNFVTYGLTRLFQYNGARDETFNVLSSFKGDGAVNAMAVQSDFKVVVANNTLSRKNSDGSYDPSFYLGSGLTGDAYGVKVQADGKIILYGNFTAYKGIPHNRIMRLNKDLTVDNSFDVGLGPDKSITELAIQEDGKIVLAGDFTTFDGLTKNQLVRLNMDGSVDNTFAIGTGPNSSVRSIALQDDGKMVLGGTFSVFNSIASRGIIRLNPNGSVDNSFLTGSGVDNLIYKVLVLPGGKILASGYFSKYNNVSHNGLVRLNPDGTTDNTFDIGTGVTPHAIELAIQPDKKILVAGAFFNFNGVNKPWIVRLEENGAVDHSFSVNANWNIDAVCVQPDGKILVSGAFSAMNGIPQSKFSRLNTDGSTDFSFDVGPGINTGLANAVVLEDGKILIAGGFTFYKNLPYNGIALLRGSPYYLNTIRGNIFTDRNEDCQLQFTEPGVSSVVVKAMPGPFYGGSDGSGRYQVRVDSGTTEYTLTQERNSIYSKIIINQCATSHSVSLSGANVDTASFNFSDSIRTCALLNIGITKSRLRRCTPGYAYVEYCNRGNANATNARIEIIYPPHMVPISSVPSWTYRQDSLLVYDVGDLNATQCGRIFITDSVVCGDESIRGMTQCIQAKISPVSDCLLEHPSWDRSSVQVQGECVNDTATFLVSNVGVGNMSMSSEMRVYSNDTLIFNAPFKLLSGGDLTVWYPAKGSTIRLEADQPQYHPGNSIPRATVEGCGSGGIVPPVGPTHSQDDLDDEVAVSCDFIRDSYDPNDKSATPVGRGDQHKVVSETELEYTIRFQNTGTDVAHHVKIVDTLDLNLDPTSFIQGASSHPYKLSFSGKGKMVLTFDFHNINLPDSTTNKAGSNGSVTFRVKLAAGVAEGTVIKNRAHIFFDFNSAIITNETFHTLDNTIETDMGKGALVEFVVSVVEAAGLNQISLFPNPSDGIITVNVPESLTFAEFRITAITGVNSTILTLQSGEQKLDLSDLAAGLYIYEVLTREGKKVGLLQFVE